MRHSQELHNIELDALYLHGNQNLLHISSI
jgi:hypothetical protein